MKKAYLIPLLALLLMLTIFGLFGCTDEEEISSIALSDHDGSSAIEIASGGFDFGAYTVLVTYDSGRTEEVALTEDMITETDHVKFYQEGTHEITLLYSGRSYTFTILVKRYAFGAIGFPQDTVFTYNGEAHTVEVEGDIPANAVVIYPGGNSFVNAGTYDVTAVVSCEGYVTARLSTTVKIERATYDMSGVSFEAKEFVYDGKAHSVAIAGKLPAGISAPTYVIGDKVTASATDVGEYTVTAKFAVTDPNYEAIPNMVTTLTITPAEYPMKDVSLVFKHEGGTTISGGKKTYDGVGVTFDLKDYSDLSGKVAVSFAVYDECGELISSSNKQTGIKNAGVYTVKVSFSAADSKNYQPIDPLICVFEVEKIPYPLSNVTIAPESFTYNGEAHSIAIEGKLPGDVTVSYEYYLDGKLVVDENGDPVESVVAAGRYTVKAVFTHTDPNREEIESISATMRIEKIKVDASLIGFAYAPYVEYSGVGYAPRFTTWAELSGNGYDIMDYGDITYYVRDADGNYTEMEDGVLPTEPGIYRVMCPMSILDAYKNNYVLKNGEFEGTISSDFEIQKKKAALPEVIFGGGDEVGYTGEEQEISFSHDADTDLLAVSAVYFRNTASGYVEMGENEIPKNAGSYKLVVTIAVKDPAHCILSDGTTVVEYSKTLVINKAVVNLDELFGTPGEFAYTGNDLRDEPKKSLSAEIQNALDVNIWDVYNVAGDVVYEVTERGQYRIHYYIKLRDTENFTMIHYRTECISTILYYTISIV